MGVKYLIKQSRNSFDLISFVFRFFPLSPLQESRKNNLEVFEKCLLFNLLVIQ